ncbi:winged helix-turn-helix transcriptional regulator [Arhodomonas sp. AD133]|uniref:winged helix-turn-helix transcriptional regulator n=1 Tax=Arhodomonas sp. AD133 TaxID=3415009 RepID=UPI003EC06032
MADSKRQPTRLDRTDRRILRILQEEGRVANVELARRVHLTPTPCLERVRRLERDGYIEGYNARLNAAKLGIGLTVFIQLRLDQTSLDIFERFHDAVMAMDEIVECHMVPGEFDYLLKIRVSDVGGYRWFMAERLPLLPGVIQTYSHVVMEEVKVSPGFPVPGTY